MSPAQNEYFSNLQKCFEHVRSQQAVMDKIATKIFESLNNGGVFHVFGTGHAHMIAEELFHRAGGLIPVNAMLEEYLMPHMGPSRTGPMERLSGLANIIFDAHDLKKGEPFLAISNSGINAVTVELAEQAKAAGLYTFAITSLTHSKAVPSRAGKKLYEVVDDVIDTGTPVGDACVGISTSDVRVAPLSAAVGVVIAQLLVCRVCELFANAGQVPPVYQSANTPGGDARNKQLEEKYKLRIARLR
ncbi:MAG TPA: SIS domain-containing protein [Bdellovibrionales bacterium]|nr:SIS domain-containing protein [Bdellovibrionales bacterium]